MVRVIFGRKADYKMYSAALWSPVIFGGLSEEQIQVVQQSTSCEVAPFVIDSEDVAYD